MKYYTATELKEMNSYNIGGNPSTNTCTMTLYNRNEEEQIETDAVFIELTQKDINLLIRCLEMYLKPEEEG